jgi:hypothetical protein
MAEPAAADLWSKFVGFIREFGLPSFLVIWFLFRIEKKLEAFTKMLGKLLTVNIVMLKVHGQDKEADKLLEESDTGQDLLKDARDELEASEGEPKKKRKRKETGG